MKKLINTTYESDFCQVWEKTKSELGFSDRHKKKSDMGSQI